MKQWLIPVGFIVIAATLPSLVRAAQATGAHDAFGGIWVISPENRTAGLRPGDPLPGGGGESGRRRGGGGGGRSGGGGRGGGGGGGFGGGGGGIGGGRDGARGDGGEAERRQAEADFARSLLTPAKQITLVVHEASVSITDDDGRIVELETTNKKVSSRAQNGLVKLTRKSKWEGTALSSEIEVEDGPKFQQKYEVVADGAELHVSTTTEGSGGRDAKRTLTVIYERPMPQ